MGVGAPAHAHEQHVGLQLLRLAVLDPLHGHLGGGGWRQLVVTSHLYFAGGVPGGASHLRVQLELEALGVEEERSGGEKEWRRGGEEGRR